MVVSARATAAAVIHGNSKRWRVVRWMGRLLLLLVLLFLRRLMPVRVTTATAVLPSPRRRVVPNWNVVLFFFVLLILHFWTALSLIVIFRDHYNGGR